MDEPKTAEATSAGTSPQHNELEGTWINDDVARREQFKLIYDYIKFHIGLYLSTPAVIGLIGNAFNVLPETAFQIGLGVMIGLYLLAGMHAGWFMGNHINKAWSENYLKDFARAAFPLRRKIIHHWFYWAGLASGLIGLLWAKCRG